MWVFRCGFEVSEMIFFLLRSRGIRIIDKDKNNYIYLSWFNNNNN